MDRFYKLQTKVLKLVKCKDLDEKKKAIPVLRRIMRRRMNNIYDIERKRVNIKDGKILVCCYDDEHYFKNYKHYIPENEKSTVVQKEIEFLIEQLNKLNALMDNKYDFDFE